MLYSLMRMEPSSSVLGVSSLRPSLEAVAMIPSDEMVVQHVRNRFYRILFLQTGPSLVEASRKNLMELSLSNISLGILLALFSGSNNQQTSPFLSSYSAYMVSLSFLLTDITCPFRSVTYLMPLTCFLSLQTSGSYFVESQLLFSGSIAQAFRSTVT